MITRLKNNITRISSLSWLPENWEPNKFPQNPSLPYNVTPTKIKRIKVQNQAHLFGSIKTFWKITILPRCNKSINKENAAGLKSLLGKNSHLILTNKPLFDWSFIIRKQRMHRFIGSSKSSYWQFSCKAHSVSLI